MKYRSLGSTDMNISIAGFGTVKLGRNQGMKYPSSFRIPDDKEALSLLLLARELGINLLDTAPAYGNSEERLGALLNNPLLKHQRHHWIICTKTGEEFENGQSQFNFSPEHTVQSVHRSLNRLGVDHLDMVLVHSDGNDVRIINELGTLDALAELKRTGKIRAFGMSTKTVQGSLLAAEKSDVVMIAYNLNERDEKTTLDYGLAQHKGILVKKAFGSGHLVNEGADPVQTSLDFIFQHQGVSSVIMGTISPGHLKHNVACALRAIESGEGK